MRYFKTQGFIIKRANFKEADRVVTIFSQNYGKIRALAKGVRKVSSRRSSHLEIFNEVNIHLYKGKTFNYIAEVDTLQTFPYLRKSLSRVAVAYQMCELIERICPEEQEQEDVYKLLSKGFAHLNQDFAKMTNQHLSQVNQRFTARFLRLAGFLTGKSSIDPEKYAELILERRLSTPKFFNETSKLSG